MEEGDPPPRARGAKRPERSMAQELLLRPAPLVKAEDAVVPPSNRKEGSDDGLIVPLPLVRGTRQSCHGGRATPPTEQWPPSAKANKEHKFLAEASAALGGEGCGKGSCGSDRVVTPL